MKSTTQSHKARKAWFSFSNVIAMVALFAALGGTAWAVQSAPRNSVFSHSIANGEVKTPDIGREVVRSRHISRDTIKSNRIRNGHVRAADLGTIVERSHSIPVIAGSQNNTTVNCGPGEVVVGGGGEWDALNTGLQLQQSHRDGNGWNAAGANGSGNQRELTVSAYCLEG